MRYADHLLPRVPLHCVRSLVPPRNACLVASCSCTIIVDHLEVDHTLLTYDHGIGEPVDSLIEGHRFDHASSAIDLYHIPSTCFDLHILNPSCFVVITSNSCSFPVDSFIFTANAIIAESWVVASIAFSYIDSLATNSSSYSSPVIRSHLIVVSFTISKEVATSNGFDLGFQNYADIAIVLPYYAEQTIEKVPY